MKNTFFLLIAAALCSMIAAPSFAAPRKLKLTAWQDLGSDLTYRNSEKGRACFTDSRGRPQAALVLSSESILHTRGKGKGIQAGRRLLKKIRARIANESESISLSKSNKRAVRQLEKHLSTRACKKLAKKPEQPDPTLPDFAVEEVFSSITFDTPVDGLTYPGNRDRLLIVEKRGIVRSFEAEADVALTSTMLDARSIVYDSGEAGLLGIAFDPEYPTRPYLYTYYIAESPLRTVVARFTVSDTLGVPTVDVSSRLEILSFSQPFENHNGGQIKFGSDGYLYIAVGDGGSANDPMGNGQDLSTYLGSMLRIDVSSSSEAEPYTIPADNPFVGNADGYLEEIFAYGLRNPWRFSVDPFTGQIIIGDVGQGDIEEIDILSNGANFGWKIKEGSECFESDSCDSTGLVDPIHEYNHDNGDRSITGGFTYHGSAIPELRGAYIFADFVSGKIWALFNPGKDNQSVSLLIDSDLLINAFVEGPNREIYILPYGANVFQLVVNSES